MYSGAAIIIDLLGAGEVADTDWHHVALVKVADEYGIYVDGSQVNYVKDSSVANFAAILRIAVDDPSYGTYVNGSMDEIRISHTSRFGVTPTTANDTSFTVPYKEYPLNITNLTIQTRTSNDNSSWTSWSSNHTNPSGVINQSARYLQELFKNG